MNDKWDLYCDASIADVVRDVPPPLPKLGEGLGVTLPILPAMTPCMAPDLEPTLEEEGRALLEGLVLRRLMRSGEVSRLLDDYRLRDGHEGSGESTYWRWEQAN